VKHLPVWFPGAGFLRKAATWKEIVIDSVDFPFSLLKANMVRPRDIQLHRCIYNVPSPQNAGTAPPSYCSTLLQESHPAVSESALSIEEFDVKWTANSMFAGSMDSVSIFFIRFIGA
jgi:hypothetical protein